MIAPNFLRYEKLGFFPEPSNLSESERDEINTQIVTEVTSKDLVSFVQLSNFPIFSLL